MAERPPDEPNLPWEEIARQVQSALEELDLDSPDTQARLMGDLQSMLSSLDGLGIPEDLTPPSAPAPVDISVVEGGLESSQPREPAESRPDLKVAPDPETEEVEADPPSGEPSVDPSSFKWFSLGDFQAGGARSPLGTKTGTTPGHILLTGSDSDSGVQTIFNGSTTTTYRITAQRGCLRIVLDGKSADILSEGRSIDVEGTSIRVVLEQAESAEGSYQRIS